MKKKILIIYPYNNHTNLMNVFTQKLYDKGLEVDAICLSGFHVTKHTKIQWGWLSNFVIEQSQKKSFISKVFRRISLGFIIYKILRKYDLIDFHAFVDYDIKLTKYCQEKGIKYDITFWGSDLMRADEARVKRMGNEFSGCRCIKSSHNLYDDFVDKYGYHYDSKYEIVYFGNSDYDEIDALSIEEKQSIVSKLYDNTSKTIVVCGYNGSIYQNHKLMIQAFKNLHDKYASSIHLVFPMTYGAPLEYIDEIRETLKNSGYTFTILDKFLSSKEVATIRKTADFVVNIQKTDAFSGSLQDHLYCNEVLLIGEWLKYTLLDKYNVYYLKTSLQNLQQNIDNVLSNLESYKKECEKNQEKMKKITSWNSVIDKWVVAYGK